MRPTRTICAAAMACALVLPAAAPPRRDAPPPGRGEPGDQRDEPGRQRDQLAPDGDAPPEFDGRLMRQRVQEELDHSRRQCARLEQALRRLDEGDAPREVWREMREQRDERPVAENITDDDRARVVAYLREHAPEMGERLAAATREHPRGADFIVGRVLAQLREIDRLRSEQPELGEVRERALSVGLRMRQAVMRLHHARQEDDAEATGQAETELRGLIGEQFDLDRRIRGFEIERLGEELARMRAEHEERLAQRDQIVTEQLEQLKNDPRPDGPPDGPNGRPGRQRRPGPDDGP